MYRNYVVKYVLLDACLYMKYYMSFFYAVYNCYNNLYEYIFMNTNATDFMYLGINRVVGQGGSAMQCHVFATVLTITYSLSRCKNTAKDLILIYTQIW